jgi:hypothetical protein
MVGGLVLAPGTYPNDELLEFGATATPTVRDGLDVPQLQFFELLEAKRLAAN